MGNASNNTVGGDVSQRNVISSNLGPGVDIRGSQFSFPTESNVVSGNYIGTDGTGKRVSYPNGSGLYNPIGVLIESDASSNTIGGLNEVEPGGNVALSQGNLISGETVAGIEIRGWGSNADTTSNVISGNFIGTDVTGRSILDSSRTTNTGNGTGVLITAGALNTTIGGSTASARNVISGNFSAGVEINGSGSYVKVTGTLVENNDIGTDSTGHNGLGNGVGVLINQVSRNDTGNIYTVVRDNLISGNIDAGVEITGTNQLPSSENLIQGNLIGVDVAGMTAIPNNVGVSIEGVSLNNLIGGPNPLGGLVPMASRNGNVISGNATAGLVIRGDGARMNLAEGNDVGVGEDGQTPVPNGTGVLIISGPSWNTIGGPSDGSSTARNIISGNQGAGIEIIGLQASDSQQDSPTSGQTKANFVKGNYIGLDVSGQRAVGNTIGILISNAPENSVVSDGDSDRNVISGNNTIGIQILGSASKGEILYGNFIGPDATGNGALPRSALGDPTAAAQPTGIQIVGSTGDDIGEAGEPVNVISGNQVGIEVAGIVGASGASQVPNRIANNWIGLGIAEGELGNRYGVFLNNVSQTQVGLPGVPNFIAGNSQAGVYILGLDATGNSVMANVIGMGPHGQTYNTGIQSDPTNPFPIGVYIQDSSANTIGGSGAGEGNTITGNNVGVYIFGKSGSATNNQVIGNAIGLPYNGGAGRGNVFYGVMLFNAPSNNAPQTGPGANQITGSGIANFREFSGPDSTKQSTGQGKRKVSKRKVKTPPHQPSRHAHPVPAKKTHHAVAIVHGHKVPAGPVGKSRS